VQQCGRSCVTRQDYLAAADGGTNVELADRLELDRGTIRQWRNRFVEDRCDGCWMSLDRDDRASSVTLRSRR
jgi:Homeodomain-like domain